jgi:hypothetical protein
MGRARSTYWGEKIWIHGFSGERGYFEDSGVDWKIILI